MAAVMRGLDAEAYDRQYSDKELVNRIVAYFRPHFKKLAIITVCVLLISGATASLPIIVSAGVDMMANESSSASVPWLIAIVFITGASVWVFNWIRRQTTTEMIADIILAMRQDAFKAAAHQDLSFYDEFSSGRIVSRITSDTQEFGEVIVLSTDVVSQLATAVILIIVLMTINVPLTFAVVLLAPLVALAALGFRGLARKVTRQSSRALGEVNKSIQEAVTGISVAKNYRQEQAIYDQFKGINQQSYTINIRKAFIIANIFPTLNILAGIATAGLVYFGGQATVNGVIVVASWYLFVATIDRFWFPVINISAFWSQFQAGLSAAERVFALMDVKTAVKQTNTQPIHVKGEISFQNVAFSYNQKEQILPDFSLTIQQGESVAFVGHTGAGKSSIIKLVARFYEYQKGQILIDGHDIRQLNLEAYRQQLGIVSQVPFLFDGTVADNIRYARPEATDAEILEMAQKIGQGEWLETLPDGLASGVGERGSRLSMGQRQLVALTRVLVQNPSIFILDEATASVDPFTESQIQQALDLIMQDRTAIVIAHRLSTVRSADRIVVLDHGSIIEQGSHEALMSQGGHYAELYDTYFRHQSPDYQPHTGQFGHVAA